MEFAFLYCLIFFAIEKSLASFLRPLDERVFHLIEIDVYLDIFLKYYHKNLF